MTENWAEERERLLKLIAGIEAGQINHIDGEGSHVLKPTTPDDVEAVRARLDALNNRLGKRDR